MLWVRWAHSGLEESDLVAVVITVAAAVAAAAAASSV